MFMSEIISNEVQVDEETRCCKKNYDNFLPYIFGPFWGDEK